MKKGFTLIEIVIVIVILGLLATLALPRITGQLEVARSAEAMKMFGTIRRAIMYCYDATAVGNSCDEGPELGVTASSADSSFTYSMAWMLASSHFKVNAKRKANPSPDLCMEIDPSTDTVQYNEAGGTFSGVITRTGSVGGVPCNPMGNPL